MDIFCFVILYISLTSLVLLSVPLLLYLLCRRVVERDLLFEENHCAKMRTLRTCAHGVRRDRDTKNQREEFAVLHRETECAVHPTPYFLSDHEL